MKAKILLIEDNREMLENTAELLELSDYDVITASNGKVGVELAKRHAAEIDLILCDIMMPELDGYGVLHILNKNPETSSIPFIYLSAKAEKQDFRTGMNLGADDYLIKPFTEIELLNAIEHRMRRKGKNDGDEIEVKKELTFENSSAGKAELLEGFKGARVIHYKKRETIFHEGDFPGYLYLVESGFVKTSKVNRDGKEVIINLYHKGDLFSLHSVLNDQPYTLSAQAIVSTSLAVMPRNDFIDQIHMKSSVCSFTLQSLSQQNQVNESRLLHLAYDSVRKRVARGIVLVFQSQHLNQNGSRMAISREDLANVVGTSTESVIRTLHDFKEEELIEIEGRNIVLKNVEGLVNVKS